MITAHLNAQIIIIYYQKAFIRQNSLAIIISFLPMAEIVDAK
jgi:hypothetical protein